VEASGLAELLACLEKYSSSESPPLESCRCDSPWYPSLAGDEWAPEMIAYEVGEAALVDEPPASEVGRGAAAVDAEVKTMEAAESTSAPAIAPATDAGREAAGTEAKTTDTATKGATTTAAGDEGRDDDNSGGRDERAVV
jgi:hypothetical protein